LNLLFIPLLYIALRTLQERRGDKDARKPHIEEHPKEQERVAV
jgi:hypothetical protein